MTCFKPGDTVTTKIAYPTNAGDQYTVVRVEPRRGIRCNSCCAIYITHPRTQEQVWLWCVNFKKEDTEGFPYFAEVKENDSE